MSEQSEAARIVDRSAQVTPLDTHPQLRRYVECFLETFLFQGKVDPRLRELVILRLAWRSAQPYEWAQHCRRAGALGVSDAEILSVRTPDPEADLDDPLRLVVNAADEVVDQGMITQATYRRCEAHFGDPGVSHEFVHLVAGYRMMAIVLNTTRPSLAEANLSLWPPDGIGPEAPTS